jgi:hypothetical protein
MSTHRRLAAAVASSPMQKSQRYGWTRWGFVNTYRTLCQTPTPEMKVVFDSLQHLALAG